MTEFSYTETEQLKAALVGRTITSTISEGADYERVLTFVLDDGTLLKAHAQDGGCACSNGCFSVEPANVIQGVITNVEVQEVATDYFSEPAPVEPGSVGDGSATITIVVYAGMGEQVLLTSEGGDNGYYGWGFRFSVERPITAPSN